MSIKNTVHVTCGYPFTMSFFTYCEFYPQIAMDTNFFDILISIIQK